MRYVSVVNPASAHGRSHESYHPCHNLYLCSDFARYVVNGATVGEPSVKQRDCLRGAQAKETDALYESPRHGCLRDVHIKETAALYESPRHGCLRDVHIKETAALYESPRHGCLRDVHIKETAALYESPRHGCLRDVHIKETAALLRLDPLIARINKHDVKRKLLAETCSPLRKRDYVYI